MRSLAAHLRAHDGHDRLPFHPSCPICRQTRMTGRLPKDDLLSVRTQALLAAGVLTVSSAGPATVAFAAEQDQQQDGTVAVPQGTSDPADSPDFDPGGDAADLPDSAPAVPQTQAPPDPGNDDTGPVDQAPTTNASDAVVDPGDGSDTTASDPVAPAQPTPPASDRPAGPTTVAPPSATPPAPDETAAPPAVPEAPVPAASTAPATAPREVDRASRTSRAGRRSRDRKKATRHDTGRVRTAPAAPAAAPVPGPVAAALPSMTTPAGAADGHRATSGDRTHAVLPGESLWTIAADLLGNGATPARVAREVHRLWQLNRDRIGTGDPDLLMVGTRLDLR